MECVLMAILEGIVHLRQISTCHCSTDTDQLLSAISKLSTLEGVKYGSWSIHYFPSHAAPSPIIAFLIIFLTTTPSGRSLQRDTNA